MEAEPGPARRPMRSRIRIGALVAGVAMTIGAGSAMVPGLVIDSNAVSASAPAATTQPAEQSTPATEPFPGSFELRTHDRRSRGDRAVLEHLPEVPAVPPATPEPAPTAEPTPEPPRIAGIPNPCTIDLPIDAGLSTADITDRAERQWGLQLSGPQWRDDSYRPVVQLFAETLDAVDCTGYVDRVKQGNGGELEISAEPTRSSWAWGDYGLTRASVLTLDFAKFRQGYADGDRGRLVRLVIHEMAHSLNADRYSEPAYWQTFGRVWDVNGPVSDYGSTPTESFADAVGYYVARCAADNPYATGEKAAYYEYVKSDVFGGREFGGAVGTAQHCAIQGR